MADDQQVLDEAPEQPTQAEEVKEAQDFKPPETALVAIDREDVYRAMDRADEEQILTELQGRALDVMVYSFEQGGTKVTDLSYAGVSEAVRTVNARTDTRLKVSDQPPMVEEVTEDGQHYYRVMVYASDESTGDGRWGTAVEPKRMRLRHNIADKRRAKGEDIPTEGPLKDTTWDKFALTKALNKAQRNALKSMLPAEFVATLVAQYLGDGAKVRRIKAGPGAAEIAELPPPLDTPEANEKVDAIRQTYKAMQDIDRTVLLPAAFNQYLLRARHRMEDLNDLHENLAKALKAMGGEVVIGIDDLMTAQLDLEAQIAEYGEHEEDGDAAMKLLEQHAVEVEAIQAWALYMAERQGALIVQDQLAASFTHAFLLGLVIGRNR